MPSIDDLRRTILDSDPERWVHFEDADRRDRYEVYVYHDDPRLRIERVGEWADGYDPHTWTADLPDREGDATATFRVYYDSSPIDQFTVVAVEGTRLRAPEPRIVDSDHDDIDAYEYAWSRYRKTIGRILSGPRNFDALSRSLTRVHPALTDFFDPDVPAGEQL